MTVCAPPQALGAASRRARLAWPAAIAQARGGRPVPTRRPSGEIEGPKLDPFPSAPPAASLTRVVEEKVSKDVRVMFGAAKASRSTSVR